MNEVIIESPIATLTKLQELVHLEESRKKKTQQSKAQIALANNESNHSNFKTKHMSLRHHFIRREIKIKSIILKFLPTHLMLADFLTKAAGKSSNKRALRNLNFFCPTPVRP
jgi:hypothetical protein